MSGGLAGLGLVVSPVLVEVVTRAGARCECTWAGCHGRAPRCERELPGHRLLAAPRDGLAPGAGAWRVPTADLAAWCERCWDAAQARVRREQARAMVEADAAADVLPGMGGAA